LLINRGNYLVVVIDVDSLDRYFLAGYRQLICDCLDKVLLDNHAWPSHDSSFSTQQMYSTAIFYAEKLSRTCDASVADQVLFAKVTSPLLLP
jgi:hypothetical protein